MVLSLLPLLQLGSMHGTVILLPKYIVDKKNENELFLYSNIISHIIQFIGASILFLLNIKLSSLVLLIIAANFFFSHYAENVKIFLNSKHEFEKVNFLKSLDEILRPFITILIFYYYQNIESIFIAQFIVASITFLVSFCLVPLVFNDIKFYSFKKKVFEIYKIGFFVYLIWAIDILFRTADRWFISTFYSSEELAMYGFTSSLAMNIWLLSMSFFGPYSQLLYTYVAQKDFISVKNIVETTNKKVYVFLAVTSIIAVITYPLFLEFIIKRYLGTEFLFFVLILSAIFLSINNMYIYYMISDNHHFVLLKYQFIILALNLILNSIFVFYHTDILYYSYSTIFSLGIYFILVKRYFYADILNKIYLQCGS
jgi:membrane protein